MSDNIIWLRPIFLDLGFWLRRPSHKNGITFQAIKWDWLIFTKNVSGKKFLECYKDQNEWQHHVGTTNISRLSKRQSHKNGITFQTIKPERLILTINVSGKMFLECYKDQNQWQHHRATTNISWPWFFSE